jgi:response regulator RpfG family c-di-GMP phosphodiesterase
LNISAAIEALGGRATDKGDAKNERVELPLPPDLALMQQWSSYIDNLSIFRKNRSTQTAQLTEALNQAVGQIVDPVQLQAAALMHDMGMAFIPHAIFNKEGLSRRRTTHHSGTCASRPSDAATLFGLG